MKVATQLYTVPRIRMRGAISPLLHMPSVAWSLIMRGGGALLLLTAVTYHVNIPKVWDLWWTGFVVY